MSLVVKGPIPARWQALKAGHANISRERLARREEGLDLAFINNMPDAALEDTELQFFELLDVASEDTPIFLSLFSLTGVPRTEKGKRHLDDFYKPLADLWNERFDAAVVTGTEPRAPELQEEPYWSVLAQVFDWAAESTVSTVLSCLAAHAAVLHFNGVRRHRLPDKQFGIFLSERKSNHPLLRDVSTPIQFPHSRWNELRSSELTSAGYSVLTESPEAGVDTFIKQSRKSLLVHFQGHPEYGSDTLLKEFRRDVKRFLRSERDTYPTPPYGCFDSGTTETLKRFEKLALENRREGIFSDFPETGVSNLQKCWSLNAAQIYRNWVHQVLSHKSQALVFPMGARRTDFRSRSATNRLS